MTFGNYIYQDNTSQSRQAAVNQLIDTADNLEAGHLKAVETASQLKTTIANLDMNEAEDGFKQQLQADLEQTIENNVQYGNMYYALDDIIKKSGDILSNPAVIGRLKAQQDYKAFQDDIDKRVDIPQYMKEWYKSTNPYHYEDKFDENGNIVGGSKWTPSNYAVSHIDGMALAEKAVKFAHSQSNTNTKIIYKDNNDNQTNPTNASSVEFYNTVTSSTEILSRKRLLEAFIGLHKVDGVARASMNAEKAHAKWARTHGDNTDYGWYREDGSIKDEDEWLEWKFNQVATAAAYLNKQETSKITIPKKGSGRGGGDQTGNGVRPNAQGGTRDLGTSESNERTPSSNNRRQIRGGM